MFCLQYFSDISQSLTIDVTFNVSENDNGKPNINVSDTKMFDAIKTDFISAMAVVFSVKADNIKVDLKDPTTLTLTFSVRKPSQRFALETFIKSATIANATTDELRKVNSTLLSAITVLSLSDPIVELKYGTEPDEGLFLI